jgi:hypothetical protein
MRLRLAKVKLLERRGAAGGFLNFRTFPQILINVNRNVVLPRKEMEIATFQPMATRKCSKRLLDSCWALLKEYRKAAGKCSRLLESVGQFLKGTKKSY